MQLEVFIWWFPTSVHRNSILIEYCPAFCDNGWSRLEVAQLKSQMTVIMHLQHLSPHTLSGKKRL